VLQEEKERFSNESHGTVKEELTADVLRGLEGLGDLGVQLDHEVVLFSELLIAALDMP